MRMPQLPPGTWTCHGSTYVGAARCRVCGRSAPVFGLVTDQPESKLKRYSRPKQARCAETHTPDRNDPEPAGKRNRRPSHRINRKGHAEIGEFLVSQMPKGPRP